jgi:hypothetical protein
MEGRMEDETEDWFTWGKIPLQMDFNVSPSIISHLHSFPLRKNPLPLLPSSPNTPLWLWPKSKNEYSCPYLTSLSSLTPPSGSSHNSPNGADNSPPPSWTLLPDSWEEGDADEGWWIQRLGLGQIPVDAVEVEVEVIKKRDNMYKVVYTYL